MTTNATTELRLRRLKNTLAVEKAQHTTDHRYSLAIWIALIGIFFPQVLIPLGFINITPGRFVVMLLFVPALATLLKRGRHKVASDFFAVALAAWMIGSSILNGGFTPYVGAEALEFIGAYLVGRAFVFGPSNLRMFIEALKRITVVVIALALLDTLSGRNITLEIFKIEHFAPVRLGLTRAASVFENAEHYGTFCAAAAAIFLYSERGTRRVAYASLTFFGTALSLSSGPFMGLAIVITMFSYDRILKQNRGRWKILMTMVAGFLLFVCLFFEHPAAWLIVHFTLDPGTGFFRLGTWDAALPLINQSLFLGHGLVLDPTVARLTSSLDLMFLKSVDCVWLVEALRYGLPGVVLLILTIVAPFFGRRRIPTRNQSMDDVTTGFSLAVVTMALVGLTVHFWDATWLFLSLCIGIRCSLAESAGRQSSLLPSNDLHSKNFARSPTRAPFVPSSRK